MNNNQEQKTKSIRKNRLESLLEQKIELENQIKNEHRRLHIKIGKIAEKNGMLHWTDDKLNIFFNKTHKDR